MQQANWQSGFTLGKCFMTHITTGCMEGILTREKLFSRRSSSFLYLKTRKSKRLPCYRKGLQWLISKPLGLDPPAT